MAIFLLLSIIGFINVLFLVRKRKLREEYSILWMVVAVIALIVTAFPIILNYSANFLKISYPPALIFGLSIIFLSTMHIHVSLELSKLRGQVIRLTQELALRTALEDKEVK